MLRWLSIVALFSLVSLGCSESEDEKIRTGVAKHLDGVHGYCFELPTISKNGHLRTHINAPEKDAKLRALEAAGILTINGREGNEASFDLTDLGKSIYTRDDGLCFGKKVLKSVDNYTTPATSSGRRATTVSYSYALENAPKWAQHQAILENFPNLRRDLATSKGVHDTVVLIDTKNGWVKDLH